MEVHYGEYVAKCDCRKSFHSHPAEVDPKAKYDHKVRQAVINRILHDKLNLTAVQASIERDFLLKLSSGYIYQSLAYAIQQFDGNGFRKQVLEEFSGVLCIDEIHLGKRVLLLASDGDVAKPFYSTCSYSSKTGSKQRRKPKKIVQ